MRLSSLAAAIFWLIAGTRAAGQGGGSQTPTVLISQIQGPGTASPYAGQRVMTSGVVTARSSTGFFLQDPVPDDDPATSEGLFVFTSGAPPALAAVGNVVQVTGLVSEFRRSSAANRPSVTELTQPSVTMLSSASPLPAPRLITAEDLKPGGGIAQLERFEGMRVQFESITATSPTGGTVNEANATASTNGLFYAVITGTARPYREAGIPVGDPDPELPSAAIPRFDGNPEMFGVASNGLAGVPAVEVSTGAEMKQVTGVLHQDYGEYRFTPDSPLRPEGGMTVAAAPDRLPDELKIVSWNMERFFDTVNDPAASDAVLSAVAFERRLSKASLAIRELLGAPDVLAVMEMENLSTLEALAARIGMDAVAAGQEDPRYRACLFEGNDVGGIDVGFLYSGRVMAEDCRQLHAGATYTDPGTGKQAVLHDRPPLELRGAVTAEGSDSPYRFTLLANHLRSLSGIDDPSDGNRVRVKRNAQAEDTSALLEERQGENTISVGDYNAFRWNDGYVDVMGTLTGNTAPAGEVLVAGRSALSKAYFDLIDGVAPLDGYSYVFGGNAQSLDHVLVNARVGPRVRLYQPAHISADFPETLRSDGSRPERLSDHDPLVVYLRLPVEITSKATVEAGPVSADETDGGSVCELTIINTSAAPLAPEWFVVLDGLASPLSALNATGLTPEELPYFSMDEALAPGESRKVTIHLDAPADAGINFRARIYSAL
ncbi:MAG: hypothetical protein HY821_22055 [Acidobacteria bacterium]|nr:hypothetical protein [Acidobacteriota bacterium]